MEVSTGDDVVLTPYFTHTPLINPSYEVPIPTSIPSTPTILVTPTIRYTPPQKTGATPADACTTEGETCGENETWNMCDSGHKPFMGCLAAGTTCVAGKIA